MPLYLGEPWATFLSALMKVIDVFRGTFQFMSERTNDADNPVNDVQEHPLASDDSLRLGDTANIGAAPGHGGQFRIS